MSDAMLATVVKSDAESLIIAFTLPDYTLRRIDINGHPFTQVQVTNWASEAAPGDPQLPQTGILIGLPPGAEPSLHILDTDQVRVPVDYPISPAPIPAPLVTQDPLLSDLLLEPAYEFAFNKETYSADALYPREPAEVVRAGRIRYLDVARVVFNPFRYNPARGELNITRHLTVEVQYGNPATMAAVAALDLADSPVFDALLRGVLLNGKESHYWQTAPQSAHAASWNIPASLTDSYKIAVYADGLYRLAFADLQAAGLPVDTLDPRKLRLFEQGQEVAIQVNGQDDGTFDLGDSLLFYGQAPRSRYSDHTLYWLCLGDDNGLRIVARNVSLDSQPAGQIWRISRYEENRFYDSHYLAADGDHWYAADLNVHASPVQTATLSLPPPAGSLTTTLRVRLVSYTRDAAVNPDHYAVVAVNGTTVGEQWWDGRVSVTITLDVDASLFKAGSNQVTVRLPGAGAVVEGAWLDTVELDYVSSATVGDQAWFQGQAGAHRYVLNGFTDGQIVLYDITDPSRPVLLQGAATTSGYTLSFADAGHDGGPADYLALTQAQIRAPFSLTRDVPSFLHEAAQGADYLIITHADFAQAVQPLVAYRRAQGLRVALVDVQDVYDEFSGGLLSPQAIHDFVAYTFEQWPAPAPAFVLLVGDGSYDFLDHYGYHSANYVPPYLAMVDPWWGETAADNRYVTVQGDDSLPDALIGRLPVTTAAEATTVIQKILSYEQAPWLGDWNASHIFVADNQDSAGNFAQAADAVYEFVTPPWTGQRIYLDNLSVEQARDQTLAALNHGALLVSFIGHSSWHQWAAESLLDIHDVPALHNAPAWPMILSMTCFTGFFHHPEYGTLDEMLLRLDGGGAVATWSPSGLGVGTGHHYLHQGFYQAAFQGDGVDCIGQATAAGKLALYQNAPVYADLLDTFHLFGDPAMSLNLTIRPWPYALFFPLTSK